MPAGVESGVTGRTAWLSQGFEELLVELAKPGGDGRVFDVLIVGSGYGGAVAAAGLAGCVPEGGGAPIDVCVLERGREYLSGMFPSQLAELPQHVRFSTPGAGAPKGRRDGLFDFRLGEDVSAVLANGLGGGSLINAGVMEEPSARRLRGWPGGAGEDLRRSYYARARELLGAKDRTIADHPKGVPQKLRAFQRLAPEARPAAISIGVRDERNAAGIDVGECKRCGDCATGCNHGSKNSLDVSLLAKAAAAGARFFTGATVLRVERAPDDTWLVHAVHTDEAMRKREGPTRPLRARRVILAAGTYGSTEVLFRSWQAGLRLAAGRLGACFSANGDAIAAVYDQPMVADAVADENVPVERRAIGPTITGMLDLRGRWPLPDCVIQEIAIPGPLRRVFEETITTAKVLHELAEPDRAEHGTDGEAARQDPCAVDAGAIRRTSVFVMMGDDGAGGFLVPTAQGEGDGAIAVAWKGIKEHRLFKAQLAALEHRAALCGGRARVLPNPLWQVLPSSMQFLLDEQRGPALTVHPLGGCPMGASAAEGVVDHLGRVFDGEDPGGTGVLPGLVVLDGSIVPNALGINPALTITALAFRAVERLRAAWRLGDPPDAHQSTPERPVFRLPRPPRPPRATEIEIHERMSGRAVLRASSGAPVPCVVEVTLRFEKRGLGALFLPQQGNAVPMARELRVQEGTLRVFRESQWEAWRRRGETEERLEAFALLQAPLTGGMKLLHRERSGYAERRCRGLSAWWWNRGMRDTWQALFPGGPRSRGSGLVATLRSLPARVSGAIALASRAGEVRRLEYRLALAADARQRPESPLDAQDFRAGAMLAGGKRITYARRSNPWLQLMRLALEELPGLAGAPPVLELDPRYLADRGVPLFKVVGQNDQVGALADVASMLAYFLRLLVNVHVWSFRRPDAPRPRALQLLPVDIPGRLPPLEADDYFVGRFRNRDVSIRLSRYRPPGAKGPPLLMIHGYSASGTTFAHHAVKPNMAEYFCSRGRDVWIVDLRTSSGMDPEFDWTFEEAALIDIPAAAEIICRETGAPQLDVFAHCMGAAMFGMAVLSEPKADSDARYPQAHAELPRRVRRAVLSQVAPVLVMSPANTFRGYAMGYLRHFLPLKGYRFRVEPDAGLVEQLTDRLLATLPYPEAEFDVENPVLPWRRTPFAGTRHRMDALYGRDFSLADERGRPLLDDAVLECIDDLFGPLSIETVAQAIHFARSQVITNRAGRNEYVLPKFIRARWRFDTLSLHGEDNGLADVATLHRFRQRFQEEADVTIETHAFAGFGHQDSLIGKNAERVFQRVHEFLS